MAWIKAIWRWLAQHDRQIWGLGGALTAAWFAVWMLFFPQYVKEFFAWDVHPRAAQLFIGGGYIFRTLFFLNAAREGDWYRLRWIVWGNLVFTGTLLLGTFWHAEDFNWPIQTPVAHIWVVLYIFEPVAMIYLIPRGMLRGAAPISGGPLLGLSKSFLVLVTGALLMNGLLLVINPDFAATRWAWALNPLDARIVGAWFLGWSFWCGTMAFVADWDEIKRAAELFILNAVVLFAIGFVSQGEMLPRNTAGGYLLGLGLLGGGMILTYVRQEMARPSGT